MATCVIKYKHYYKNTNDKKCSISWELLNKRNQSKELYIFKQIRIL